MNKCMETFKKIIVIILEIILFITFCGVVFYFLFPEIFGKEKKSEEVAENPTEKVTYVSTEARTTEVSDSDTEVSDATTEVNASTKLFGGSDEGK